jgi:hypothetical protein
MNPAIRKVILDGIKADLAAVHRMVAEPGWCFGLERREQGRLMTQSANARENIVAYEPSHWLGRTLTSAERMAFSRELEQMQADGLIQRMGDYGRTVQVQLLGEK